jgi:general secretion pathway protein D
MRLTRAVSSLLFPQPYPRLYKQGLFILSILFALSLLGGVYLEAQCESLPLKNKHTRIHLNVHQVPIGIVLKAVASQASFNIVLSEQLNQKVSLDFKSVEVTDVLMALKQIGKLYYYTENDTLFVSTQMNAASHGMQEQESHILVIEHLPANFVAQFLNETLFASQINNNSNTSTTNNTSTNNTSANSSASNLSSSPTVAVADPISNRVILKTDRQNTETAARLIKQIDIPRLSYTWRLNYQNAPEVAQALASSIFANGSTPLIMTQGSNAGGNASSASGTGTSNTNTSNTSASSTNTSSNSSSNTSNSSSTTSNNNSSNSSSSTSRMGTSQALPITINSENTVAGQGGAGTGSITLQSQSIQSLQASIYNNGVILLPDTRLNTLTIFGTEAQLKQAHHFIQEYDQARQQVVIELHIIEMANSFTKLLTPSLEANLAGRVNLGFNANLNGQSTASYLKNPIQGTSQFNAVLNFLQSEGKLKVIANPSIMTMHNEEANINIVDEVIQGFSDVRDQNNNIVARVANLTGAGINLHIRPRLAANGDISLMVNPLISFPQPTSSGDIQLISSREIIAKNIILKEGQSFILGGLQQHLNRERSNEVPGLSHIPILGGLSKTFDRNAKNQELLIMITPRRMPSPFNPHQSIDTPAFIKSTDNIRGSASLFSSNKE